MFRVENAMTWVNFSREKKEVVINSLTSILDIKYPNWKNNDMVQKYEDANPLFKHHIQRMSRYENAELASKSLEEVEEKVETVFRSK